MTAATTPGGLNQAVLRRHRPKEAKIRGNEPLRTLVREKLTEKVVSPADRPLSDTPGHWEGDLIIGRGQNSAIGTLVEPTTRYVHLIHLPHGWKAPQVRNALITQTAHIPPQLKRTLTRDQGRELTLH
jgi:hypothetical protein